MNHGIRLLLVAELRLPGLVENDSGPDVLESGFDRRLGVTWSRHLLQLRRLPFLRYFLLDALLIRDQRIFLALRAWLLILANDSGLNALQRIVIVLVFFVQVLIQNLVQGLFLNLLAELVVVLASTPRAGQGLRLLLDLGPLARDDGWNATQWVLYHHLLGATRRRMLHRGELGVPVLRPRAQEGGRPGSGASKASAQPAGGRLWVGHSLPPQGEVVLGQLVGSQGVNSAPGVCRPHRAHVPVLVVQDQELVGSWPDGLKRVAERLRLPPVLLCRRFLASTFLKVHNLKWFKIIFL